ncbi:MAG: transglutaminase-like domain-containing protein [Planctomycetia bacterium]
MERQGRPMAPLAKIDRRAWITAAALSVGGRFGAAADAPGAPPSDPAGFECGPWNYLLFAPELTLSTERETATVAASLPIPQVDAAQYVVAVAESGNRPARRRKDARGLNHLAVFQGEVLPGSPLVVRRPCVVAVRSLHAPADAAERVDAARATGGVKPIDPDLKASLALSTSLGRGRMDIAARARVVAAGETNSVRVARRLYDDVLERLVYRRLHQFKGAAAAWDQGVGECGDYVAVFVALCRAVRIPARAVCGFSVEPDGYGLHVWAEFHTEGVGWIPCDLSYGDADGQPAAKEADRFFGWRPAERIAVARDFDLEFVGAPPLRLPILQEFAFRSQGPETPRTQFRVGGGPLGDEPPADAARRLARIAEDGV